MEANKCPNGADEEEGEDENVFSGDISATDVLPADTSIDSTDHHAQLIQVPFLELADGATALVVSIVIQPVEKVGFANRAGDFVIFIQDSSDVL